MCCRLLFAICSKCFHHEDFCVCSYTFITKANIVVIVGWYTSPPFLALTYISLYRKHELLEEDIAAHGDRINDLNKQCDEFINAGVGDAEEMKNRQDSINERFANVKVRHSYLL